MPETTRPFDPDACRTAVAPLLGLDIDPAWAASITANLTVLAAAGELLTQFPLPDDVEAAPRFEA